mmetsp:Transcript_29038/g.33173  ORF Transcript_29038/g.33173 Transcript_29038/m.33173 type:complete len:140 (+) Transcript_29038:23-442(+)|eukprot:CAMPEP_0168342788 /NCGR_PEP_ID=MMETSP0213-20121227/15624_1 /TAXON_ID=151035 /ORGANISM="Euplotes harpa, Strain FSP1.4" /LENGTH=139 /DNA_ID=CAMNT_0008349795 /DNA_START=23 /DNA_END=442 /DNA_ORIENTATION=+
MQMKRDNKNREGDFCVKIENHTEEAWAEAKHTDTYRCRKSQKCGRVEPGKTQILQFLPQKGMCGIPLGVGADSWFVNTKGDKSFYLEWGVPACGKPWVRVKNLKRVRVATKFENKNLEIEIIDATEEEIGELKACITEV